jgi:hypothetical protein
MHNRLLGAEHGQRAVANLEPVAVRTVEDAVTPQLGEAVNRR